MMSFGWPLLSAALLLSCLVSFNWGMRKFFSQPAGDNAGMKLIRIFGSAFALLHLAAIILTPQELRQPFYFSYLLAWVAGIFATARLWLIPLRL
jgi:hypothetical protein